MTQATATTTKKRKPRPPAKKKGGASAKKAADAAATETPPEPEAPAEEPAAAAPPAEDKTPEEKPEADKKPARRAHTVAVQGIPVVLAVIAANELAKKVACYEPEKNATEVFTPLNDCSNALGEDPVNVESAMRLLEGLGLCVFIVGRKGKPNRAVWTVGNLPDIIAGNAEEYVAPEKVASPSNRPLSAAVKIQLTPPQRAALCKELEKDNIDRADLKTWGEELLVAAVEMLVSQQSENSAEDK